MGLFRLVLRNTAAKPLRTALTAVAVAVGVGAVVTLGVVTASLRETAVQILEAGDADFLVAEGGNSDILNSTLDEADLERIREVGGVETAVGVLVALTELDADNPAFLMIGVAPDELDAFGVTLLEGAPYDPTSDTEIMLGYRAARNLGIGVGDTLQMEGDPREVVGIYRTGQEFGDAASMRPLVSLQANERKQGLVTVVAVKVRQGAAEDQVRAAIEEDPNLTTLKTATEFNQADRNLQLITAADTGARVLAIGIGALVVASAMLLSFVERTREFGVLRAVGWGRRRIITLVMGEGLVLGLIGAAVGVSLSVLAVELIQDLDALRGLLDPEWNRGVFWRALTTAATMAFLGAAYPALRAAFLVPLEALRRE